MTDPKLGALVERLRSFDADYYTMFCGRTLSDEAAERDALLAEFAMARTDAASLWMQLAAIQPAPDTMAQVRGALHRLHLACQNSTTTMDGIAREIRAALALLTKEG